MSLSNLCAFSLADFNPDLIKDEFYHQLDDLLKIIRLTDIEVLATELSAQVKCLGAVESRFGGE